MPTFSPFSTGPDRIPLLIDVYNYIQPISHFPVYLPIYTLAVNSSIVYKPLWLGILTDRWIIKG